MELKTACIHQCSFKFINELVFHLNSLFFLLFSPEQERDVCFLAVLIKRVDYVILVARWPDHKIYYVSLHSLRMEAPRNFQKVT